jgi:DNA adenine methylase
MKYMGSKNRIAKHILPIILKDRKDDQWYVEPFVGGANMIDKVDGNRMGADLHWGVISALRCIRDNPTFLPTDNKMFTELDYNHQKNSHIGFGGGRTVYHGYVGFALSYGGKWFGGWRRDGASKRDYVKEAFNNAQKQSPKLQGVKFIWGSYKSEALEIPENSIIYCDPPYGGATGYKDKFSSDDHWQWCRDRVAQGHKVFISEYNAPDDFVSIWEKEIVSSLTKQTGSKKGVEKLFIHESQLDNQA